MNASSPAKPPAKRRRRNNQSHYLSRSVLLEELGPPGAASALILLAASIVFGFIVWASLTSVSETTHASGEIVPGPSVTQVQHLEGGIVAKVHVTEGELVSQGHVLVTLDPVSFEAQLQEISSHKTALLLRRERLYAFAEQRAPQFHDIDPRYEQQVNRELSVFKQQIAALDDEQEVIAMQRQQKHQEVTVLERKKKTLETRANILNEMKNMRENLSRDGLVSRVVYLGTLEQYHGLLGDIAETSAQIDRALSAGIETENRLAQLLSTRRSDALIEASKISDEIATATEQELRLKDRVTRLDIRAPVRGVVKGLNVKSQGIVLAPGAKLLDIVPIDEELVVEARVSPADIGHVKVGQIAMVKLATFDHARDGALNAHVRQLSATTFLDPDSKPYYKAELTLSQPHVGNNPEVNRILPGMTGEVSIVTGSRTIMRYLLRPVFQSLDHVFSER